MNALLSYRATLAAVFLLVNAVGYSATTDKDLNLQAGVGDSPSIKLISANSQQLVLQKLDTGDAVLTTTDGKLCLQPNGDTDDYLCFESLTDLPTIYWQGVANNAPGIRISATGQLEYRDEDTTTWVSFDSLDNVGSLTFADGDLLDLSPINGDSSTEGLLLPQSTDTSASTAVGQISWDTDDNALYVGDGTTVVAIGGGSLDVSYDLGSSVDVDTTSVTLTGTLVALPTLDVSNSADGGALSVSNTGAGNSFLVADEASDTSPFVIDAAGNVGIANNAPLYTLDVAGTTRSTDLILPQDTDITAKSAEGQISWDTDDNALYVGDGVSVVAIGGGGSLDVSYDLGSSVAVDLGSITLTGTLATLPTLDVSNSADGGALSVSNTGAGNSFLVADEASDTTPFVIDTAGNVGIGVGAPSYTLDVAGTTRSTDLILPQGTDVTAKSAEGQISWDTDDNALYVGDGVGAVAIGGGGGSLDVSYDLGSSVAVDLGSITLTGTLAALPTLDVSNSADGGALSVSSSGSGDVLSVSSSGSGDALSVSGNGTGNALKVTNTGNGNSFFVEDQPSDATPFVINSGGNVGIGVSSPLYKLDVAGTTRSTDLILPQGTDVTAKSAEGQISWDTDDNVLYVGDGTNVVAIGVGGLDDSYNVDSVVTVDTGSVTLTGALAALPTLDVSNSADGGALSVSNTGAGNSFLVADEASDTTPFVIDTAGNVGIGEATPSYTLDVAGTTRSTDLILPQGTDVTAKSAEGQISWDADNDALYVGDGTSVVAIGGGLTTVGDGTGLTAFTGDNDGNALIFEGTTDNAFDTTLVAADTTTSNKTLTLPDITGTLITNQDQGTVVENMLAPTLAFDAGDLLNLSAINDNNTIAGLILPQANDVSGSTAEGQISWDADNDALYVGDGTTVVAIGVGSLDLSYNEGSVVAVDTGSVTLTGTLAVLPTLDVSNSADGGALSVSSSGSGDVLSVSSSGSGDALSVSGNGTGNALKVTNTGNGNSFLVADEASDTTPFVIDTAGNVGIGEATPSYTLDVAGTTRSTDLILPQGTDVTAKSAEGQISWDADNDALYVGDGTSVVAIGGGLTTVGDGTGLTAFTGDNDGNALIFEGITDNAFDTTLVAADTTTSNKTLTLPDITGTLITNQDQGTVVENMLAPTLAFDAGDLLNLSAINDNNTIAGLILPQANDVSGSTAEGQISWDADNDALYVGDGTTVVAIGVGSLDLSYNEGSVVAVDTGSVTLTGTLAVLPTLDVSNSADGGALSVSNTGAGNSFLVADEASDTTPFVIDAAGNVGIANNAPSYTLDVAGTTRSTDLILPQDSNANVLLKTAEGQISWDTDDNVLYVGDGTNVVAIGVGGLDDSYNVDSVVAVDTGSVTLTGTLAVLPTLDVSNSADGGALSVSNTGAGNSFLVADEASDTTPFVIDATGNVGIATSVPLYTLDVAGTTRSTDLILPQGTDVTAKSAEGQISWDADNDALYVGDGTSVVAIGGGLTTVGDGTGLTAFTGDNDGNALIFEGTTDNVFDTTLVAADTTTSNKTLTLPDITGTLITNQDQGTVVENMLAPTLAFDAGDLLNLSAINDNSTTAGLILPQANDVSNSTAEGQISWDADNDALYVGDGTTVVAIGVGSLDLSYNEGSVVAVDTGSVTLTGTLAVLPTLDVSNSADGNALSVSSTGTGDALKISNTGAGHSFLVEDTALDATPFVIDTAGNVGIGEATPSYTLDVAGTTRSTDLILPQGTDVTAKTALGQISWDTENDALYVGDGTTVVAIGGGGSLDASYNEGNIVTVDTGSVTLTGTLAVLPTLDVSNSADGGTLSVSNTGTGNAVLVTNSGTGYSLVVEDSSSDPTPFVVDTDGNVGIGEPTPVQRLEVVGRIRAADPNLANDDVYTEIWNSGGNSFLDHRSSSSPTGNLYVRNLNTDIGADIVFRTQDLTRMTIDGSGNVGIVTDQPLYTLDVAGTTRSTDLILPQDSNANVLLKTAVGQISWDTDNKALYVGDGTNVVAIGGGLTTVGDGTGLTAFTGDNDGNALIFEGTTDNVFDTTLVAADTTTSNKTLTLPDITGTLITNQDQGTVVENMLAPTLAFDAGDLLNLSAINDNSTTAGLILPQANDVSGSTTEGQISWDADNDALYVGDGTSVVAIGGGLTTVGDGTGLTAFTGDNDGNALIFEGTTDNAFDTTLVAADTTTSNKTLTLPDISGTLITDQDQGTVVANMLAPTLAFDAGDLLNLSAINDNSTTAGLILPQANDVSGSTTEGQISWDTDDNALYIGDGAGVVAIGVGGLDDSYNVDSVVAVDTGSVTLTGTLAASPTLVVSNTGNGGGLKVVNDGAGNGLRVENIGNGYSLVVADETSDTTPFVIDATGNVGIGGDSTPSYKLNVAGTTHSTDLILPQDSNANVLLKTAVGQISWDTENDALYVGDGTNVVAIGVGGLDDSYNLGSSVTVDTGSVTLTGTLNPSPTLDVSNSGNGGALIVTNTGTGTSFLVEDFASDTSPFVITSTGNVGIGLVSPTYRLEVAGTTRSNDLILPQGTDVTAKTALGQISWDTDDNALYVGDGTTVVAIGGGLTTVGDGTGLTAFTGDNDGNALIFEGTTDNAFDTTLVAADTTTSNKTLTLPDITGTLITDQDQGTVVENMLAPTLAFDAGDLLNLSAINDNSTTAGLILPQANDVSGSTAEGQISWDADNDALYVGDGTTVVAIGVGSLDLSYNEGSVVAVDTGSVTLTGTLAVLPTLDVSNSADGNALSVSSTGTGDALKISNTGAGHSFLVEDTALDATPFVIDTAGNVGIGEATPSYTLDVAGTTRSTDLILPQDSNANVLLKTAEGQISWDTENDALYVGDGTTVVAIGVGSLDASYNVDSVVTVDTGSVTLLGTLANAPTLYVSSIGTGSGLMVVNGGSGDAIKINNFGTGNNFVVADVILATTLFVIDNDGNVGIGEPTPGYTLDVAGMTRSTDLILPQDSNANVLLKTAVGQISWDTENDALYVGDGTTVVAIGGGLTTVGDGTGLTAFTGDNDGNALIFEGTTDNALDTTLVAADTTTSNKTLTLPDITGTLITDQDQGTVVENMLAPTLAFDAGDLLNLSAINDNSTTAGLILPQANDVSGSTTEGQISWDTDDNALYIGDGAGVVAIGVGGLDDSYNVDSVVAVDTGSVTLTGTLAASPTLVVSNTGNGGGLKVVNDGAGNGLRVENIGNGYSLVVADETSDTTPFVIDATGNVGIGGDSTPSYKLNVAGTTHSTDLILPQDSNANVLLKTAEGQISWDTDDNVLYVGDGTNVVAIGVGGLDDSYNVDSVVAVDTGSVTLTGTLAVLPTLDVSNSADGNALSVSSTGTGDALKISNTGAGHSFLVEDTALDATPFVIDTAGNVGIGEATPSYTLDVAGTTRSTDLILPQDSNANVLLKTAVGQISWDTDNDALYVGNGVGVVAIGVGSLDASYNVGSVVAVDTGSVTLTGTLTSSPTLVVSNAGSGGALSIRNTGTGNTFLIEDQASDATPFVIDAGGNIGIGDPTPGQKLEVAGIFRVSDTNLVDNNGYLEIWHNGADGHIDYGSSSSAADLYVTNKNNNNGADIIFQTQNATRMTIDGSGNVGIGTDEPLYTLDVAGTTRSIDLILPQDTDVTAKSAEGQISWDTDNDALYVGNGTTVVAIGGGNSLDASYDLGNFVTVDTGSVTLTGTLAFLPTLDVSNSGNGGALSVSSSGSGIALNVSNSGSGGGLSVSSASTGDTLSVSNTGAGNSFLVADEASDTTPFVIDTAGNVGIGEPTPAQKLEVTGALRVADSDLSTETGYIDIRQNGTSGLLDFASSSNSGNLYVRNMNTTDDSAIFFRTQDISRMIIDGTGNIGIGTTNPSYTLDVAGTTHSTDLILPQDSNANVLLKTAEGQISWDTDNDALYVGDGTTVVAIGGGGSLDDSYNEGSIVAVDTDGITLTGTLAFTPTLLVTNAGSGGAFNVRNTGTSYTFLVEDSNNDSTPFMISSDGNVGIGDPTPARKLEVVGTIRTSDDDTNTNAKYLDIYHNGTDGFLDFVNTVNTTGSLYVTNKNLNNLADIIFKTRDIDRMTISGDGFVGIGTVAPSAILDVANTSANNSFVVADEASDTTPFVIDATGNVGIANSSPLYTLDVAGTTRSTDLILPQDTDVTAKSAEGQISWDTDNDALYVGNGTTVVAIGGGNSLDGSYDLGNFVTVDTDSVTLTGTLAGAPTLKVSTNAAGGALRVTSTGNGSGIYLTNSGGGYTFVAEDELSDPNPFVIDAFGNVGIGDPTPNQKLEVVGGIRVADSNLANNDGYVEIWDNDIHGHLDYKSISGTGNLYLRNLTNNIGADIVFRTRDIDRMTISGDGNVGIGTTNPLAKLDVRGNCGSICFGGLKNATYEFKGGTNAATSTWAFNNGITGLTEVSIFGEGWIVGGGGIAWWSDERIKNRLGVSDKVDDLDTLMQIEIVDYDFIDKVGKGDVRHKKVFAQQVAPLLPSAITYSSAAIPDIYVMSEAISYRGELATISLTDKRHGLLKDDQVKIITDEGEELLTVVAVSDDQTFTVTGLAADVTEVFVFGKQVDDFHSVDYSAISMLNVSATQQQQQLIERLESKLADQALKNVSATEQQQQLIESLESKLADQALKTDALEARLNALENR